MNTGFTFITEVVERRAQRISDRKAASRAAAVLQAEDRPAAGPRRPAVVAWRRRSLRRRVRRIA